MQRQAFRTACTILASVTCATDEISECVTEMVAVMLDQIVVLGSELGMACTGAQVGSIEVEDQVIIRTQICTKAHCLGFEPSGWRMCIFQPKVGT